jgi:hypothetical protein
LVRPRREDRGSQAPLAAKTLARIEAGLKMFGEPSGELTPWNGRPYVEQKPDGPVRQLLFGGGIGFITYLVLEEQQRVDVLDVLWLP